MKGYKAFNKDLTCKDFQYEVGKTYEMKENPICCKTGFHFCKNIADVYKFYPMSEETRICEVFAIGDIVTDNDIKFCANKIKIVKEIKSNAIKHCNIDKSCNGYCNSGDCNSGNYNSGIRNSGDCNSGDCNSGDYNSGDYNSGFCNTTNAKVRLFNHETDLEFTDHRIIRFRRIMDTIPHQCAYTEFIFENKMSDKEKENHPGYKTTGGCLKTTIINANKWKWWTEEVSEEDKEFIKSLPYYDAEVFFESTGINKDRK